MTPRETHDARIAELTQALGLALHGNWRWDQFDRLGRMLDAELAQCQAQGCLQTEEERPCDSIG